MSLERAEVESSEDVPIDILRAWSRIERKSVRWAWWIIDNAKGK